MRSLSATHCGRGAAGAPVLRAALDLYETSDQAPASVLEARVLRMLAGAGVPHPVRQHEVRMPGGRRRYLDFAWPSLKVAVEADGYQWHSSRSAWDRDRKRLRELQEQGWSVLTVTHEDLKNPEEFLRTLGSRLQKAT